MFEIATTSSRNTLTTKEKRALAAKHQAAVDEVRGRVKPALLEASKKLEGVLDQWVASGFQRQHDLGRYIDTITKDVAKYGENSMKDLAVLHNVTPSLFYKAQQFYNAFKTADEVRELANMRMKISGARLSWHHVDKVLGLTKQSDREKFLKQAAEHDWTPDELYDAIHRNEANHPGKHGGGRPRVVPATVTGRLENFAKLGNAVVASSKEIWSNSTCGFRVSLDQMPADKVTPEFIQKLDADIVIANNMVIAAEEARDQLIAARQVAQEKLTAQALFTGDREAQETANGHVSGQIKGKRGRKAIEVAKTTHVIETDENGTVVDVSTEVNGLLEHDDREAALLEIVSS
jgi:hypothetical protein